MSNIRKYSILIILTIILQSTSLLSWQDDAAGKSNTEKNIYLIKSYWHVGIVIEIDSASVAGIPVLKRFSKYNFVDIGWGDEDFFQDSEIDYYNAAKAILFPTKSVIKITAHLSDLAGIIRWSDFCIKLKLTDDQYSGLLEYIDNSFLIEDDEYIFISSFAEGAIVFYKSGLSYHLFNTCNTWVAEALETAGCGISKSGIITAEDLFVEVKTIGEVLKEEKIE